MTKIIETKNKFMNILKLINLESDFPEYIMVSEMVLDFRSGVLNIKSDHQIAVDDYKHIREIIELKIYIMSDEFCDILSELINVPFRNIVFQQCNIGDQNFMCVIKQLIKSNIYIRSMCFDRCIFPMRIINDLAYEISHCDKIDNVSFIKTFELERYYLGSEFFECETYYNDFFKKNTNIKRFDMIVRKNEHLDSITKFISDNYVLENLELYLVDWLEEKNIDFFFQKLAENTCLKTLALTFNFQEKYDDILYFFITNNHNLINLTLQILWMRQCDYLNCKFISALKNNCGIKFLTLQFWITISDMCIILRRLLQNNNSEIENICIKFVGGTMADYDELVEILENNYSIMSVELYSNNSCPCEKITQLVDRNIKIYHEKRFKIMKNVTQR